ncbi:MAG: ABC transporter ATP-binding protein [Thermoprotei archaeon]|nr:ABC transporter ATP-binding protein [Thermoprotei archaeon]
MAWYFRRSAEQEKREIPTPVLIKWMLKLLKPLTPKIILIIFIALAQIAVNTASPYIGKLVIDEGIMKRNVNALAFYVGLSLALAGLMWITRFLRGYLTGAVSTVLLYDLRKRIFGHLTEIDVQYVAKRHAGKLISLVTNDVEAIRRALTSGSIEMLVNSLTLVGAIYVMISLHLTLSLMTFTIIPVIALLATFFARKTREAHRLTREKVSELTSSIEQGVSGAKVAQAFIERKKLDIEKFERVSLETMRASLKAALIQGLVEPSLNLIRALATAALIIYGGALVVSGGLTIGSLFAFLGYLDMFFRPVIFIATFYSTIQSALAAAERIYSFLNAEPEVKELPGARDIKIRKGEIIIDNIDFSYGTNKVFKNFSLHIKPGEVLAVVGPTGAGKTTLASLILRLHDPQKGRILIDGHDLREFTFRSLRSQIALVPQEPILFDGTIMDNIKIARPDANDEDVKHIVRALKLEHLIKQLPKGYNTMVAPGGSNLSLGQRQLISFARVMLKNPKILILDEATSSLDSFTEAILQEAMFRLMKGRTCIVIAHRLSTVKHADRIIVLDNGRIVEEGTHEELLKRGGLYAKLYKTQLGAPATITSIARDSSA